MWEASWNEISLRTIRKMKWTMPDFIENRWLENEIEADCWCSISLKIMWKTMKLAHHVCTSVALKSIRKTMKWEPHRCLSISLRTFRKTMKWDSLWIHIGCPDFIISLMKFINEITLMKCRMKWKNEMGGCDYIAPRKP